MARFEARRWAKALGISFSELEDTYRELRQLHKLEREREWMMRQTAWERMTPKGCHEFWRHGFRVRYPHAFGEGDRTNISGFDTMADGLTYDFPELLRDDEDPAATLFEFLATPHNRLPTSEESWDQAMALLESGSTDRANVEELEAAPF